MFLKKKRKQLDLLYVNVSNVDIDCHIMTHCKTNIWKYFPLIFTLLRWTHKLWIICANIISKDLRFWRYAIPMFYLCKDAKIQNRQNQQYKSIKIKKTRDCQHIVQIINYILVIVFAWIRNYTHNIRKDFPWFTFRSCLWRSIRGINLQHLRWYWLLIIKANKCIY